MESSLRPTISTSGPAGSTRNAAGHVVGYPTGDRSMKNVWEPSYPQNLAYEGWPSKSPQFELGNVAGKKAAEGFATDPKRETAPGATGAGKGKE
jgi:hypothetical protein